MKLRPGQLDEKDSEPGAFGFTEAKDRKKPHTHRKHHQHIEKNIEVVPRIPARLREGCADKGLPRATTKQAFGVGCLVFPDSLGFKK